MVRTAAAVLAGVIVLGIVLVLLEANRSNDLVNAVLDAGRFLAEPFDNIFKPDGEKARIGINWGIAAAVYLVAGGLIASLLRR